MDFKIVRLSELGNDLLTKAVSVCIEGFYKTFSVFTKDKDILLKLFKNSFDYEMTYAYVVGNEAAGFLGLANSEKRSINNMNEAVFVELFGKAKGKGMSRFASPQFMKPRLKSKDVIEIDYLATHPNFRGQGVATRLLEFVFSNFDYRRCELVVHSKNPNAKKLYEKVGFKEQEVKIIWITALLGLGKTIIMSREMGSADDKSDILR